MLQGHHFSSAQRRQLARGLDFVFEVTFPNLFCNDLRLDSLESTTTSLVFHLFSRFLCLSFLVSVAVVAVIFSARLLLLSLPAVLCAEYVGVSSVSRWGHVCEQSVLCLLSLLHASDEERCGCS